MLAKVTFLLVNYVSSYICRRLDELYTVELTPFSERNIQYGPVKIVCPVTSELRESGTGNRKLTASIKLHQPHLDKTTKIAIGCSLKRFVS